METRWLYVTSEELVKLREESKGVCVIPIGCVEKHGLHLPLGADILQASRLTYEASKLETFTVFPDFVFGDVPENYPNMPAGSVTLPLETEMLLLEQLCDQIARNGYKKIAFFNYHGGNEKWLAAFLRKLENKPHDYVLVQIKEPEGAPYGLAKAIREHGPEYFPEMTPEDVELILKYADEKIKIGHGCFIETAHMLGLYPELVHMERLGIESGQSTHMADKYSENGLRIRDSGWFVNYPNAYSGDDPIGCNERIGKAAVRYTAEHIAKAVKFYKEDEDLIKWHNANWNTNI